jgi:hypothetical protein
MVAEHKPLPELTYEEQIALARANFERNQEAHRKWVAEWIAENGDPAEALHAFVRETFDKDALLQAWKEWRAEQGKPELEGW